MRPDAKLSERFRKERDLAVRGLGVQRDNTVLCQSYYNSPNSNYWDMMAYGDETGSRRRRAMVRFQKIQQNIDSVVGFLAQNRRQAKYIARVNSAQQQQLYSRNMNALYTYHRENMNADQLESRQDLDLVVCGYGAIDTDVSYMVGRASTMPGGEIVKMRIDPMRVYWDPAARGPNVEDRRFCGYYQDYDLKDALNLFEKSTETDFEFVSETEAEDKAGYVYNPWGGLYDKIKLNDSVDWSAKEEEMVRVYNHQWFEYETFYRCDNPLYQIDDPQLALFAKAKLDVMKSELKSYQPSGIDAGDLFDFDPLAKELTFDAKTKSKLVAEFGELIKPVSFIRKCFYTMIISGDHIFAKFKNISQQGFSIQFKTGQYNERGKFWIGMCNSMIEPEKYYNKALTELMFTISANSKGGWLVEEGAVEDMAVFEAAVARTDGVVPVMDGALSGQKIQDKARPALPTGLENIIQISDAAISSSGVDPAFLGQTNNDETGILFKRRIRQIISKMWWVADANTLYQKEDARLCEDFIRVWCQNNEGQWIRITGPDGADQFMQVSEDMMTSQYDVSIQEGAQTPEDKEQTSAFVSGMADKYLSVGNMQIATSLHSEAVQMLPLDGDIKNRISQTLVPSNQMVPIAQVQQLQQQIQQLTSQINQAQVDNLKSMTALNVAKVGESHATADNKKADSITKLEDAHQKNIETQVIAKHAGTASVTV